MKQKLPLFFMTLALLNISLCAKADLKKTVNVFLPGTISGVISESEKSQVTDLTVTGTINGDDIRFIREMAGVDVKGQPVEGSLIRLDLSGVEISAAGGYYYQSSDPEQGVTSYYATSGIIGSYFMCKSKLRECILPKYVKEIKDYAFAESDLESITISEGLEIVGSYTFARTKLRECVLPNSVNGIKDYAFYDSALQLITFPESLDYIGWYAFSGCNFQSLTVPEGIAWIAPSAFANCVLLETVNLPSTVSVINPDAFEGDINLIHININEANPKFASIEGTVVSKDLMKLYLCPPGIGPVYNIPASITEIEPVAFTYCSKLAQFSVDAANAAFESQGAFLLDKKKGLVAYAPSVKDRVVIPEGVENICKGAFRSSDIQEVVFPQSLRNISDEAFIWSGITSISFSPNMESSQLKTIQTAAFCCCQNLKEITLPLSLKGIGEGAFTGCTNLSSVNLPTDLDSISSSAFSDCEALKKVVVPRAKKYGSGVFWSSGVETVEFLTPIDSIPSNLFRRCASLKEITIPEGVKSVKLGAFSDCSSLEKVNLPESLEEIDGNAFCYTNIKDFTIPKNVKKLGLFMLSINDDVTVYSMSPVPPLAVDELGNAFYPRGEGTLYVPSGCKDAYLAAAPWNEFGNIYEFDPAGVDGVMMEDGMEVKEVYSSDGTRLDGMQPGMNIVRAKNGRIHKVIVR